MGRPQVAAQAQAQAQTAISHTESLELVRCLLRVSIFHVSYLRGLFPEKSFKGVDMKNLDDMHIKMLLPACDESRRLVDWVEGGVYDAIKKGYLKNLFFGISNDPEGTQLLEEYIFSFKYGDGKVMMDVNAVAGEGARKQSGKMGEFKQDSKADLNTVRYQVCRLIRMLVQVCRTLDKVPAERYLFMKLTYQDHTPDEYEPPYFVPVDESGVGHFKRSPFSMAVGRVATDHHSVSLKVKSTLDSCDDPDLDAADGEGAAAPTNPLTGGHDRVTAQAQPSAGSVGSGEAGTGTATATGVEQQQEEEELGARLADAGTANCDGDGNGDGDAMDVLSGPPGAGVDGEAAQDTTGQPAEQCQEEERAVPPAPAMDAMEVDDGAAAGAGSQPAAGGDEAEEEEDVTEAPEAEEYHEVAAYVKGRTQVSKRQLGRQFAALSQPALDGYVERLQVQGLLAPVPGARNTFRVVAQPPAEPSQPAGADAQSAPAKDAPADTGAARGAKGKQQAKKAAVLAANDDAAGAAAMLTERLDSLTVKGGGAAEDAGTVAAGRGRGRDRSLDDLRRSRDQEQERESERAQQEGRDGQEAAAMPSRGGRVESAMGGDELTGSQAAAANGGGGGGGGEAAPADDDPNVYIVGSQQSGLERAKGGRVRKASYVADPIQQGNAKKPKTSPDKPGTAAAAAAGGANKQATAAGAKAKKAAAAVAAAAAGDKAAPPAPTPRGTRTGSRLALMRR
ncbi:hypothetical protein GPECTOR_60g733 [Gonium pectorale]|uniref:HORMA domain-containing protein n=1 Tax=Gonium pectorale TaxID=33097 RepID=A0A150G4Z5_GONPE|nr:hypothetical protein GPECTOR_60g733 [Gonium pectorale]|eukprot:KXZ44956.1 hypothetical protein GPECTOR_60g733 [Gonium pectorale]